MSDKQSKADDAALIVCGSILFVMFWGDPDLYDLIFKLLQAMAEVKP